MILILDNYDSFTHNLARYFRELGCEVKVVRNDQISLSEIERLSPQALVVSPGPCTPDEAGISLQAIEHFATKTARAIPILGVCLGHQAIGQVFGARVVRAAKVMHGKSSLVQHNREGLFQGLTTPMQVVRYHSLVLEPASLPDELLITAWCEPSPSHHSLSEPSVSINENSGTGISGHEVSLSQQVTLCQEATLSHEVTLNREVMAIQHRTLPVIGVQFHPESVLSSGGHQLLDNFINFISPDFLRNQSAKEKLPA